MTSIDSCYKTLIQPFCDQALECNLLNMDIRLGKVSFQKYRNFRRFVFNDPTQYFKNVTLFYDGNTKRYSIKSSRFNIHCENNELTSDIKFKTENNHPCKFTIHKEGILFTIRYNDIFQNIGLVKTKLQCLLQQNPSIECSIDLPFGFATFKYKYDSFSVAASIRNQMILGRRYDLLFGIYSSEGPFFVKTDIYPLTHYPLKLGMEFKDDENPQLAISLDDATLHFHGYRIAKLSLRRTQSFSNTRTDELYFTAFNDFPLSLSVYGYHTGIDAGVSLKFTNNFIMSIKKKVYNNVSNFTNLSLQYGFDPEPKRISFADILKKFKKQ